MSDLDIGTLVAHLKVDDAGMDFKGALEKIKGFGGEGGKAAKVAGVAIAAGLATAVASAMNVEPARKKIAAQLRLTPAEQATINASADKLFSGNYAENIGEANDVLRSVITNFKDMRNSSSEDLTAVGVMAQNTASLMGEEFDKVTKVAGQLVKDGLAKNATEAFDLITAASQNTSADMQGDLLEVAGEYSKHFATLGISGSEAMKLISDASADGAIGMDKVGDALKELTIRATDMSTSSVAAYQAAGLNAQEMSSQILKGGDSAHAGFEKIVNGLLSIEDPTARANAAIGLFGTPLEDLGTDKIPAFLNALKDAGGGLGDVAGRADEAGKMLNDSTQASFQTMLKTIQTKAIEIGELILPLLAPIVDFIGGVVNTISKMGDAFSGLASPIGIGAVALTALVVLGPKLLTMLKAAAIQARTTGLAVASAFGPLGFVLAGATLAIGLFSSSNDDAGKSAQETAAKMSELADTVNKVTGAYTGATTAKLTEQLSANDAAFKAVGSSAGAAAAAIVAGGKPYTDLVNKLLKTADATDIVNKAFDYMGDAWGGELDKAIAASGETQESFVKAALAGGDAWTTMAHKVADSSTSTGVNFNSISQGLGDVKGAADKASPALVQMVDSQQAASAASKDTAAQFRNLTDAAASVTGVDPNKLNAGLVEAARNGTDTATALTNLGITGDKQAKILEVLGDKAIVAAAGTKDVGTSATDAAGGLDALSQTDADTKMGFLADETANAWAAFDTAADSSSALEGKLTPMAQAAQDAADAQSSLDEATKRVLTALDKLAGRTPDVEQANSDLAQATDDMAQKFGLGTDKAEKLGTAILNTDGTIKTATQGGRDLRDATLGVRESMANAAQAAYDNAVANGDLKGAQGKATAAANVGYDAFIKNATAILGSKSAAEKAAAAYGLVPRQVSSTIKADNSQAVAAANEVARKLAALALTTVTATATMITNLVTNRTETITTRHETIGGPKWMGGSLRGYATGGSPTGILGIPAPADPRQDNLLGVVNGTPFKFRGDEFIMNPKASKVFGPQLKMMNAAVPAFAAGGVPSAAELAGLSPRQLGQREGITSGALKDLNELLKSMHSAFGDAAQKAKESYRDTVDARNEQKKIAAEGARDVAKAKADRAREVYAAQMEIRRARAKGSASDVTAAYKKLEDAQRSGNQAIASARAAQVKANGEATVRLHLAQQQYAADTRLSRAARAKLSETERDMKATSRARSLLVQLSKQADQVTENLATAQDKLTSLTNDRNQMRGSLRNTIAGYDSGILGHAENRTTAADIIRGLQFNNNKIAGFSADINKAKSLGLSASLLQQIAGAGVDGGATTAHALATATKAQIAQINQLQKVVLNSADSGALGVANATYAKSIADNSKVVAALTAKLGRITVDEVSLANAMARAFSVATPQQLAVLVAKGQKELARR